jgi:hypothetical protein
MLSAREQLLQLSNVPPLLSAHVRWINNSPLGVPPDVKTGGRLRRDVECQVAM